MHKIFSLLFLSVWIMASCSSSGNDNSSTQDSTAVEGAVAEGPQQWITYEGEAGSKHIVLVSGDEEYRSEEAMPLLAKILNEQHGFTCTVLFAQDPEIPGTVKPDYNFNVPGLEHLGKADLMISFLRFRNLPDDQMNHIDQYLKSGKPVMGLRTATHAFDVKDSTSNWFHYGWNYAGQKEEWHGGFGRLVLGETWIAHHGHHRHESARGITAPGAEGHAILNGIADGSIWAPSDVYRVRLPLPGDSKPLVLGQVIKRAAEYDENDPLYGMRDTDTEVVTENRDGENPNEPLMPIAWVKSYQLPGGQLGRAFTTTTGAATDLLNEGVRRMIVNASYWLLDKEVPTEASVAIPEDYNPTAFFFTEKGYWEGKDLKIEDIK